VKRICPTLPEKERQRSDSKEREKGKKRKIIRDRGAGEKRHTEEHSAGVLPIN